MKEQPVDHVVDAMPQGLQKTARVSNANKFGIIGQGFLFEQLISHVELLASTKYPILIEGERGTGKTLFAHYIHYLSNPSLTCTIIDCATSSPNFMSLPQGTIIFKHINKLSLSDQEILAQAFNKISSRIFATSTESLARKTINHQFNAQLFYCLNVAPIEIPGLSNRRIDIPLLINFFLTKANQKYRKSITITSSGVHFLCDRSWKKNILELKLFVDELVEQMDNTTAYAHWDFLEAFDQRKNDYNQARNFVTLKTN